jgi:hypothetical protein
MYHLHGVNTTDSDQSGSAIANCQCNGEGTVEKICFGWLHNR